MNINSFESRYLELSKIHQKIVLELLRRIAQKNVSEYVEDKNIRKKNIKDNIQKLRLEKGYTLQQFCDFVNEQEKMKNGEFTKDTLNSIIKRNTQNSQWTKDIAEAFDIKERVLLYGTEINQKIIDSILMISSELCDIKKLFDSLSKRNQEAMLYLVRALLISETSPEVFNDNDENIE